MTEEEARGAERIWSDVERLRRAYTSEGARCHVAYRISAGFTGGQAGISQQTHDGGNVFQLHKMELAVLTRGHVASFRRVVIGDAGENTELLRIQQAGRNLDAYHLEA